MANIYHTEDEGVSTVDPGKLVSLADCKITTEQVESVKTSYAKYLSLIAKQSEYSFDQAGRDHAAAVAEAKKALDLDALEELGGQEGVDSFRRKYRAVAAAINEAIHEEGHRGILENLDAIKAVSKAVTEAARKIVAAEQQTAMKLGVPYVASSGAATARKTAKCYRQSVDDAVQNGGGMRELFAGLIKDVEGLSK